MSSTLFSSREAEQDIEEGSNFVPKFDDSGLIACVVTEVGSGELLMVAHMNAKALELTVQTGEAWFFSRARRQLWKKGEVSGHVLHLVEMRVDCDQDVLWLKVHARGAGACHTGRRSCFYRAVVRRAPQDPLSLEMRGGERVFDPVAVYGLDRDAPETDPSAAEKERGESG